MRTAKITLISLVVAGLLFAILAEPDYLVSGLSAGGSWVGRRVSAAVEVASSSRKEQDAPAPPPLAAAEPPRPSEPPNRAPRPSPLTQVEGPPGFAAFWRSFRVALLERDVVTVASMTQFPFAVRRSVEDAPGLQLQRKHLQEVIERALERDMPRLVETPSGVAVRHETQRAFLQEHEALTELDVFGERWARVGDLQFRFKAGRWRWYLAILDP